MNQSNDRLFVITGGPGVGKTAIIRELERRGVFCVQEAARQIIQQQVKCGGDAVPWMNRERYASLMLNGSIQDYLEHAAAQEVTFFDRGILDTIAYTRLIGFHLPAQIYRQALGYRCNTRVFFAAPWLQIYETDSERKQTFDEAIVVDRLLREVYAEHGYEIVDIPQAPVQKRADFVLSSL